MILYYYYCISYSKVAWTVVARQGPEKSIVADFFKNRGAVMGRSRMSQPKSQLMYLRQGRRVLEWLSTLHVTCFFLFFFRVVVLTTNVSKKGRSRNKMTQSYTGTLSTGRPISV